MVPPLPDLTTFLESFFFFYLELLILGFSCASLRFRYEDFFGSKRRKILKRKSKEDSSSDDELDDEALNEVV
jgi:hypothetical protein